MGTAAPVRLHQSEPEGLDQPASQPTVAGDAEQSRPRGPSEVAANDAGLLELLDVFEAGREDVGQQPRESLAQVAVGLWLDHKARDAERRSALAGELDGPNQAWVLAVNKLTPGWPRAISSRRASPHSEVPGARPTITARPAERPMEINPYLNFNGQCRPAFEFHARSRAARSR